MNEEFEQELQKSIEEIKSKATPRNISRMIVKGIARYGVGFVAATLVKTYCPTENKKQQLQLMIGAYVIGGIAADAAGDWAVREFDEAVDFVLKCIGKAKDFDETTKESPAEPTLTEVPTE